MTSTSINRDTTIWASALIRAAVALSRVTDAYRFRRLLLVTSDLLPEELAAVWLHPRITGKYGVTEDDVAICSH